MTPASQAPLPPRKAPPSEAEVRAALDRMASDPEFGASERRLAFLRFVVEETLAGRAHQLKGFTIANAVYGRDESFDSRTDPVVRLEARRLRQDLELNWPGVCLALELLDELHDLRRRHRALLRRLG